MNFDVDTVIAIVLLSLAALLAAFQIGQIVEGREKKKGEGK
ncbi:MAG TPA: hypothetical protein PLR83_00255 [Pyrinomonadaceae bacterium]|nr:hypothetical protein [Pyrinomonadaceae bacterium]